MNNFRPLPVSCWESFLSLKGYKMSRIKGSHYQWTKNGRRTIPVWGNEKEIPAMHLKTSIRSMGLTLTDLYKWSDVNC